MRTGGLTTVKASVDRIADIPPEALAGWRPPLREGRTNDAGLAPDYVVEHIGLIPEVGRLRMSYSVVAYGRPVKWNGHLSGVRTSTPVDPSEVPPDVAVWLSGKVGLAAMLASQVSVAAASSTVDDQSPPARPGREPI